jgi:hypothetical protein
MNRIVLMLSFFITMSVTAQTIYKCPKPDWTTMIQQMPCSLQGGGETMTVTPLKASGEGLRESERTWLKERDEVNAETAKAAEAESHRQEALTAEHRKAKAAEDQAAAQRATAAAIWATRRF